MAAALVLAGAAGTPRADRPERFLRQVYAPYLAGDQTVDPTGKAAPMLFDARLLALIHRDHALAKGEVGDLDWDPLCACQDFGDRLSSLSVSVLTSRAGRATARVRFVNGGTTETVTFALVATRAGWRIADIASRQSPSLVRFLQRTTRKTR